MRAQLFQVSHVTTYQYRSPVSVGHHLLRLTPRRLRRQWRICHDVRIDPAPTVAGRHTDYFGNEVSFITLEGAHRQLVVASHSRVAVGPAFIPDATETPAWEHVRSLCRTDRSMPVLEATEFAFASPSVPVDPSFGHYASESFTPGRPILEAVLALTSRIHSDFTFDPTATNVSTPLAEVFEKRRGVCQDFAHLQIGCLRSLGLPSRYVGGYLETIPPPGQPKLLGADASHAWVSFFCPGIGWIDVDPTNNVLPSMQHITVAWGRDFNDVSPIRGVLVGGGDHTLRVQVDVTAQGEVETETLAEATEANPIPRPPAAR